ncbi:7 transmembrane receptor, partial [Trichostrongylus colubriformis]
KRAIFTISLVWIFSFVCNIGSLYIFDSVPYRTSWTCDTTKGPLIDFLYQLYVTLVLLFIPLCVMISLYGHVIYTLSTVIVSDNPVVQQSIMQAVGVCASAYTLAVIAVERYYAICRPLQSRKWKTKKRAIFTISLVWIFSFVCNIGSLYIFDSVPYRTSWTCDTTKGPLIDFLYQLYVTLVLLFIPLCVMISLYGHVIYTLSTVIVSDNPVVQQSIMQELPLCTSTFSEWLYASVGIPSINGNGLKEKQQSLSIPSSDKLSVRPRSRFSSINTLFGTPRNSFDSTMMLRSTNQDKILTAKKKVTRMLMTIVAAFAACWLPNHLWWLLVRASDLAVRYTILRINIAFDKCYQYFE